MSELSNLPGVTLDPRNEAELEAAFGVTSNAEELIKANRARVTPEHRKVLKLEENAGATDALHEVDEEGNRLYLKDDLAKKLGHPVESARVRGRGRNAVISYVYIGERGSFEKDYVPYAEVFGKAADKRAAQAAAGPTDPKAAADAAAEAKLAEAETKATETLTAAREEAAKLLSDTREEIANLLADAQAQVQTIREQAAEDAPKAAEDAEEKAKTAAAKTSGGAKPSGSRSRSSS